MADPADAWHDNVGGVATVGGRTVSFYVDHRCILCTVCTETAPENFAISDDEDHDRVVRQPADPHQLRACEEAMAACPVEAIGDDGSG